MKKTLIFALTLLPQLARAEDDPWGVNDFTDTDIALGSKPLRETIGGIVNIVLGFLGILATLIILLGGFKWMTSAGNTEQVDTAKKLISAGIIGLVIILTAYAISRFVLGSLYNETVVT